MFRIYANKNNKPAKYSKDNVPYKPKHFLPISLDGVEENDFTLVFGFPGTTNEYLPSVAIKHITTEYNPSNIAIREAALKVIDANIKKSDAVRIKYASKQARIANYWKKWIGENLGIQKSKAIAKKRDLETSFTAKLIEKGLEDKYGNILPTFDKLYTNFKDINIKRRNFIEVFIINNQLMEMLFRTYKTDVAKDKKAFEKARKELVKKLKHIHKNYDVTVDKQIYKSIMPLYTSNVQASIYKNTNFTNINKVLKLLEGTQKQVRKKLAKDAAYKYAKPMIEEFYKNINPKYRKIKTQIAAVQKHYIKALMEVVPSKRYFPDANSTLRVTYGKVKGYAPRDAVYYNPVSYLDGVLEKYVPNDYEFDVPQKLQELYKAKDYGKYADKNGKLPICFLGTNHTTGGNSGSPAIDANGNLIGLNFDRVWEGTMSDMNYDPEICRNIMVDVRYILFIIDKYAGATRIINELKLVHPKEK